MSKSRVEKCPFREGSASEKIYMALAKSDKPMTVSEIAKRTKVPEKKVKTLTEAYVNPMHLAPLLKVGCAFERVDGAFKLVTCLADPDARRPERRKAKKNGKKNGKKTANGKHQPGKKKPIAAKAKVPAQPKSTVVAEAGAADGRNALNEREKLVLSTLRETPRSVDEIIAETKLRPEEVLATLLVLEVRRMAKQHPGKTYSK